MIKFKAEKPNGQSLYGFGLSEMNILKLKEGKPISFDLGGISFLIFYGTTEQQMQKDLQEFIGPDTEVKDEL